MDLDLERKCRNCLHRKTGWTCGNARSTHFQQHIRPDNSCQYFEPSKAEAQFIRAASTGMLLLQTKNLSEKARYFREAVSDYTGAITIGLPVEDEVAAKFSIATACAHIVSRRWQSTDSMAEFESAETGTLILNLKDVGVTEKKYNVDHVARNWVQLSYVDLLIDMKAAVIGRDKSQEESEKFVREQLANVSHVIPTPLPQTTLRLGQLLLNQRKYDEALTCFQSVYDSISRPESSFIPSAKQIRQRAESGREACRNQGKTSPAPKLTNNAQSSPSKSGCFIATAAYGSDRAPEVVLLRLFRDDVLLKSLIGRLFIRAYYCCSPIFATLIARNQLLQKLARLMVIQPIIHFLKRLR